MSDTSIICEKCGLTEEIGKAKAAGWLIAQREGKRQGWLIIRCPEHITEHARRAAGLSQRIHTGRIEKHLDTGLEVEYRQGYKAIASERESGYQIGYFKTGEAMPALAVDHYDTVKALASAMANLEDIRKWKIVKAE